jgi:predicted ester cyclase
MGGRVGIILRAQRLPEFLHSQDPKQTSPRFQYHHFTCYDGKLARISLALVAERRLPAVLPASTRDYSVDDPDGTKPPTVATRGPVMSAENKALVRRFYEEIDNGNVDAMDELVAENYVDHSPPPFPGLQSGREGVKQSIKLFWTATPGRHRIEDQIAEDDKVVTRLTAYGAHEGDLPGIARTGNKLEMTATVIHRIADGKLAEKWANKDLLGFLQQLGVIPKG